TGIDTVIIDANDLHCADCIGASKGVSKPYVEKLFLDNPSGNSEQQTPIVVIKSYKEQTAEIADDARCEKELHEILQNQ
ncbi:MAG: F420-0:Gamma-glutamyl ligase, partial [Thermoanaerobacterium sp.]|nr:F420-0:Gamma-glutamyl ligase [Thermoanaerobacterium sp.]